MKTNVLMRKMVLSLGFVSAKGFAFVFTLMASAPEELPAVSVGRPSHVIFQDTFSTNGTLSGCSVEVGDEDWVARSELMVSNGVVRAAESYPGKNALLPFVPQGGRIYRLSADYELRSGGYAALGFVANSTVPVGNELFADLIDYSTPWMYMALNGNVMTFTGPGGGGSLQFQDLGASGRMMVELNTCDSDWIAYWYFNGTLLRTNVYAGALTNINYVGFGGVPISDLDVDHFVLEEIEEVREEVIYTDSFTTNGSVSGRVPESGFGQWTAKTEMIATNGVLFPNSYVGKDALLPFIPRSGRVYCFSADLSISSGSWVAMGFASSAASPAGNEYFSDLVDNESPWLTLTATGNVNTFTGPGTSGPSQFLGRGTNGTVLIELDTRFDDWEAIYHFNGEVLRTNTYSGRLDINYVGFGVYPLSEVTIDNMRLEAIEDAPELSVNFDYRPFSEIWDTSLDLDFFRTHTDELSVHHWRVDAATDTGLSNLLQAGDLYDFDLSMEFGALRCDTNSPGQSGEIAADFLLSLLDRVDALGGEFKRVYFDHPWQLRYLNNPDYTDPSDTNTPKVISTGMSWEDAIQEMANFIEIVETNYPSLEMWILPAFLNYAWKDEPACRKLTLSPESVGDFYDELTDLLAECKNRSIHLDGVLIDAPYSGAANLVDESGTLFDTGLPSDYDRMARIRDLEYETEIRGLDFAIINNTPIGTNTLMFYKRSLQYIQNYTGAPYYGSPAVWAPWSWYASPYHFGPEYAVIGDPEYSYTIGVLANAITERVKRSDDIVGTYWGFSEDGFGAVGGWQWQDLVPPVFDAGYLKTVTSGDAGQIFRDDLTIDGSQYQTVEVALAIDGGSSLPLHYQINNGSIWYDGPSLTLTADGQCHVYSFDLQNEVQWTGGTVTAVCFDLAETSDVCCWMDYIWIY